MNVWSVSTAVTPLSYATVALMWYSVLWIMPVTYRFTGPAAKCCDEVSNP